MFYKVFHLVLLSIFLSELYKDILKFLLLKFLIFTYSFLIHLVIIIFLVLGLNSGPHAYLESTLPLE
jgi:hypothetical protein